MPLSNNIIKHVAAKETKKKKNNDSCTTDKIFIKMFTLEPGQKHITIKLKRNSNTQTYNHHRRMAYIIPLLSFYKDGFDNK